jgi:hypothetical protein
MQKEEIKWCQRVTSKQSWCRGWEPEVKMKEVGRAGTPGRRERGTPARHTIPC